ncbi:MAG: WD40 repeat domain-containing protein [Cyclobacteriaceae bacterium]
MIVTKKAFYEGHSDCVYTLCGALEKDYFYSAGGDGNVVLWNSNKPEEGKKVAQVDSSVYALNFNQEKKQLVIGQNFDGIHVLDVENNTLVTSVSVTKSAIFDIYRTEKNIFIGCGDGEVVVLDSTDFTTVKKIKFSDKSCRTITADINGNVYFGFSDCMIRVLDAESLTLKKEFKAHENSVFGVSYYEEGDLVYSVSRDAHIRCWDVKNDFKELEAIPAHMYAINDIQFKGDLYATCSMDKSIKIWNAKTNELLKVIEKSKYPSHGTSINKILWLTTDELISCSDDRKVASWEIQLD